MCFALLEGDQTVQHMKSKDAEDRPCPKDLMLSLMGMTDIEGIHKFITQGRSHAML